MKIAFDIDGTLADCTHRRHYVEREPADRDWCAFHEACGADEPSPAVLAVLLALHAAGHKIAFFSGRGEQYRNVTEFWLALHGVPAEVPVYLRARNDNRADHIVKAEYLEHFLPDLIFDDRQSVVDMWRARGIPCFQVAPGDF